MKPREREAFLTPDVIFIRGKAGGSTDVVATCVFNVGKVDVSAVLACYRL